MIGMKSLLNMVITDAIERGGMSEEEWSRAGYPIPENPKNDINLPPIDYRLELLRRKDGTLYWSE